MSKSKKFIIRNGTNYKDALPEEKHELIETFLKRLNGLHKISKETGVKLCVETFIKEYRHLISGRHHGSWTILTDKDKQEILKEYETGQPIREIARGRMKTETTIKKIIKNKEEI